MADRKGISGRKPGEDTRGLTMIFSPALPSAPSGYSGSPGAVAPGLPGDGRFSCGAGEFRVPYGCLPGNHVRHGDGLLSPAGSGS